MSPHRKHAIDTTEMLDFLKEIVESVPDPSAGGTIDLQAEAAENAKRKRSKAKKNGAPAASGEGPKRRRKKKEDVDSEEVPKETMGEANSEDGEPRMEDDDEYEQPSTHHQHRRDDYGEDDMPYVPR